MNASRLRSYSSERHGPVALAREARALRRLHIHKASSRVAAALDAAALAEAVVHHRYGLIVEGLDVLDIGAGPQQVQLHHFASRNRAVGIDLDVDTQGFDPTGYVRMLRRNGPKRTAKTLVRKACGIDARYRRALREALGTLPPRPAVIEMDVTSMDFDDEAFDFVYSSSVLQHVPVPARALDEIARVLRPGMVAYATLQLFTSETGSLDPRSFDGSQLEPWAHLRHDASVTPNAYLNRLRLTEWERLFARHWPGSNVCRGTPHRARLEPLAQSLHGRGLLTDYDVEELIIHDLCIDWRKPAV